MTGTVVCRGSIAFPGQGNYEWVHCTKMTGHPSGYCRHHRLPSEENADSEEER